jgi:hypothetical protein
MLLLEASEDSKCLPTLAHRGRGIEKRVLPLPARDKIEIIKEAVKPRTVSK